MFKITILALGRVKEKYFSEAIQEYLKRLKPFAKIELVELKAEAFGEHNKVAAKKTEGERIQNYLDKCLGFHESPQVFLLDERGVELTSAELAEKLDKISNHEIIFVIGGALGLDQKLLVKYQKISLSKLTFLHEMVKVILVEQIYRAITIIKGKSYHY